MNGLRAALWTALVASCSGASPGADGDAGGDVQDVLAAEDSGAEGTGDAEPEDDAASDEADADAGRETCNVVEEEASGRAWECDAPEGCTAGYDAFLALAAEFARPIAEADLLGQLWDLETGAVPTVAGPLPAEELRAAIVDALNVGFLLDGLCERPLQIAVTSDTTTAEFRQLELLFTDPYVGTFPAVLLLPLGTGSFPALVALHGHGDDAAVYRDDYHGREWPARGVAILMLTLRVMGIDVDENRVSHDLLRAGFALAGLRSYETLLAAKYLRSRSDVAADRIGLIGHSGGSSVSNLTVRIDTSFLGYVSDNVVDWFRSSLFELYHCETAPALYPYHDLIDDFSTSSVPVLAVPYGYTDGLDPIFAFCEARRGGLGEGSTPEPRSTRVGTRVVGRPWESSLASERHGAEVAQTSEPMRTGYPQAATKWSSRQRRTGTCGVVGRPSAKTVCCTTAPADVTRRNWTPLPPASGGTVETSSA